MRLEGKEDAYPGELSGGQQQRIAIARTLAMNPDVMLFDEVTAALDPETVKDVLVTIRELAEDGMTCMLVTHEMGFAREVADQVYFTDGGVIVEHGPPKEFFANPSDRKDEAVSGSDTVSVSRGIAERSRSAPHHVPQSLRGCGATPRTDKRITPPLQPQLLDHRAPALGLGLDEGAEFFRRRVASARSPRADRPCPAAP